MLSTLKALWENGEKNEAAQESLLHFALMSLRALCIQKADPEAEKSMGIKIVQLLLHDLKLQGINNHDDLYRIYEIIFERGQTMPLSEYYRMAYEEGMLRRNKKFYIGWINACNAEENVKMKREAIAKARESIPDIDKDQTFSALANVSELDNTCAIFKRRSTVAALRARKIPNVITTGQRQKMMVPEAVLNGNSNEELLVAKLSDLYKDDDMDISVIEDEPISTLMNSKKMNVEMSKLPRPSLCFAQANPTINDLSPIVEDQDQENSTNGCSKTPHLVTSRPLEDPSPARAPPGSKKNRVEPEPEIAYGSQSPGLSFTTKITREAQNIFSETVTFQSSRGKKLDFDTEQSEVEPTENAQFEVFCDQEKTYVEPAAAKNEQPVEPRKPFTQLNPAVNMTFDINEPTVAGTWKMGSTGEKIFTSSPVLAKNQELSDTRFLELALNASEEKPEEQVDNATKVLAHLSAEQDFDEEAKDKWPGMAMGASTFAKRRSFFTGRSSLIGRSSLSGSLRDQHQEEQKVRAASTKQEVRIVNTDEVSPTVDLDSTGIGLPEQNVTSQLNPWSPELRNSIMANFQELNVHDIAETCSQLRVGSVLRVSGEEFAVDGLLGEGGFAKVYRARNDEGLTVALKYEVPSCAWEAYILQAVHIRVSTEMGLAIMKIDDMYIFRNASLIVNEYLSMGNMLQCINNVAGEVSYSVVLHLFIQLARILKEVHAARIIHGDVKPDNVMFIGKLPEGLSLHADELLSSEPTIRLIDWGRAIDLASLPNGTSFRGRAGTQCFDCPEMLNDRPWTYQTDCFSFAASLHVAIFKTYGKVVEDTNGFMFEKPLPRRRPEAPYIREVMSQMLNIPSCEAIPSWDNVIEKLTTAFKLTFRSTQWAEEAKRYNMAISNFKPGC